MTQGSSNWYSPGPVTYRASNANVYRNTAYRRVWSAADDDYIYEPITQTLYTGYTASSLAFEDESGGGHTLYDTTSISANGGGAITPITETKTFLVQGGTTALQNFAFDMEE